MLSSKIGTGKQAQRIRGFMICARIESLILERGMEDALARAFAYVGAGADAIMRHMRGYLRNTPEGNAGMMMAAHVAGRATNVAQTTAGHAMCYKITSLFGVAHGHAAALCVRRLYPWTIGNAAKCVDRRGEAHLRRVLSEIGDVMGCDDAYGGAAMFERVFDSLELEVPEANARQYEILRTSVNPIRGPWLVESMCAIGARPDLGRPTTTPQENKRAFMEHLRTLG